MTVLIDWHGHYTTAPASHDGWRDARNVRAKLGV